MASWQESAIHEPASIQRKSGRPHDIESYSTVKSIIASSVSSSQFTIAFAMLVQVAGKSGQNLVYRSYLLPLVISNLVMAGLQAAMMVASAILPLPPNDGGDPDTRYLRLPMSVFLIAHYFVIVISFLSTLTGVAITALGGSQLNVTGN